LNDDGSGTRAVRHRGLHVAVTLRARRLLGCALDGRGALRRYRAALALLLGGRGLAVEGARWGHVGPSAIAELLGPSILVAVHVALTIREVVRADGLHIAFIPGLIRGHGRAFHGGACGQVGLRGPHPRRAVVGVQVGGAYRLALVAHQAARTFASGGHRRPMSIVAGAMVAVVIVAVAIPSGHRRTVGIWSPPAPGIWPVIAIVVPAGIEPIVAPGSTEAPSVPRIVVHVEPPGIGPWIPVAVVPRMIVVARAIDHRPGLHIGTQVAGGVAGEHDLRRMVVDVHVAHAVVGIGRRD